MTDGEEPQEFNGYPTTAHDKALWQEGYAKGYGRGYEQAREDAQAHIRQAHAQGWNSCYQIQVPPGTHRCDCITCAINNSQREHEAWTERHNFQAAKEADQTRKNPSRLSPSERHVPGVPEVHPTCPAREESFDVRNGGHSSGLRSLRRGEASSETGADDPGEDGLPEHDNGCPNDLP